MKREYKSTLIIIGVIILILTNLLFFWIGYQSFLHPILGEFEIINVDNSESQLVLNVSPSHNATEYEVEIKKEEETIFQTTSTSEKIILENFYAEYNDELEIKVFSINKNKERKESNNVYTYIYKDATFQKNIDHYVARDRDLILYVLGYNYEDEEYTIELFYEKNKIYESNIEDIDIVIPASNVEGYSGRLTAYLKNKKGRIISNFNFYLNTPIVGKLTITNPDYGYRTRWDDIVVTYKGGENANHFYGNLYSNGALLQRFELESISNKVTIPASLLLENTDYEFVLEAVYEDYFEVAKTTNLTFSVSTHETTNPVYVSHNPSFIKAGTKISLNSMTEGAKIYYTIDGSEPTEESFLYTEPFIINGNTTIKTFAYTPNRYNSVVNTYDFKIQDKNLVVYLSPSNQDGNYGVRSTGFTTEMAIMNRIADVVEYTLKNNGVTVYRNSPSGDINAWIYRSNTVGADFHLAIHSNASSHHTARGIEIYVDDETAPALSISSNIYENLWGIYSGNNNYSYHRGVKYARGSLGEVNRQFLHNGALIEVAYHDEYNDALWIMENIENIGQNIANSIISYYN